MTRHDATRDCITLREPNTGSHTNMSVFSPIPLGRPIPNTPHAVSCSLPTMRAIRGYEEKDPAITEKLGSGYPRFVVHPYAHQLTEYLRAQHNLTNQTLWLTTSEKMVQQLAAELTRAGTSSTPFTADGIHGLSHADEAEANATAKLYLQNVGGFISSREAEDRLVEFGELPSATAETLFEGDALSEIRHNLQPLFSGTSPDDILIANCGMNAIAVAYYALAERQAKNGRTIWIQLGWLYLDTISLLKRSAGTAEDYVHFPDVFDLKAIRQLFAEKGDHVAGIIIEAPTNPLLQTPNLAAIAAVAHEHGAALIIDPSISSPYAVDVLPYADIVVASLTKYTASEGDLMAGLVVVNPTLEDAATLRDQIASRLEPAYPRDLARLAQEIGETSAVLAQIHRSVAQIVDWLEAHPAVNQVLSAHHSSSRANYEKIARSPEMVGSMISFTLHGSLEEFYDRLPLPKGPSFGMKTTLVCPFIYLAHYNLVNSKTGGAELAASGINPDLVRFSVGCEPAEDIIAALEEALA